MMGNRFEKINYETFDYHSPNPKDFNELLIKDKELIEPLLKNKSLFVFSISFLTTRDFGMWEYYALPNDDPEEFKYEIHFKNIISEYRINIKDEKEDVDILYGISKIDLDFYLENFDFFNKTSDVYLLIAEEKDILSINKRINEIMCKLIKNVTNTNNAYVIKYFEKLNIEKEYGECILISIDEDSEFREIIISYQN